MSFIDDLWSLGGFLADMAKSIGGFIVGLGSMIWSTFGLVMDTLSFLPPAWTAILVSGLVIVAIYAIHRWVKHIEIGGFKI